MHPGSFCSRVYELKRLQSGVKYIVLQVELVVKEDDGRVNVAKSVENYSYNAIN